jgi:hypothetical protein
MYPQSKTAAALPQKMNNFPRFNEQRKEEQMNEESNQNEVDSIPNAGKMNNMMEMTLDKIKKLKQELEELKAKKKAKLSNKLISNNKSVKTSSPKIPINPTRDIISSKNPSKNEEKALDNIINKYSAHKGSDELAVFENIFRNYNQTNSNKVDVKEVNRQIKETMKTIGNNKDLKNLDLLKFNKPNVKSENLKKPAQQIRIGNKSTTNSKFNLRQGSSNNNSKFYKNYPKSNSGTNGPMKRNVPKIN